MFLPSKDRRQFAGKVHDLKKKHLNNMVMDGKLPLRPGELDYCRHCLAFTWQTHEMVCCDIAPKKAIVAVLWQQCESNHTTVVLSM